jgi:hypothetical protein
VIDVACGNAFTVVIAEVNGDPMSQDSPKPNYDTKSLKSNRKPINKDATTIN